VALLFPRPARGQTALVAAVDKFSTLLAVVLSVLILHESLTWRSTIGALLMVGGILVISL
jgi:transporter family protein